MTVATDPAMSMQCSDPPQAVVRVALKSGRVLERTTAVVRGDAAYPAGEGVLEGKFRELVEPVVGGAGAERIVRIIERLDTLADVRELTAALASTVPADQAEPAASGLPSRAS